MLALLPFYVFAASADWKIKAYAFNLLLPFIVIFAAERLPKLAFLNRFDISYGVYIYAFLVQQMLVWWFGTGVAPTTLSLLTVAMVTPIATASWFFVEKPALSLKKVSPRHRSLLSLHQPMSGSPSLNECVERGFAHCKSPCRPTRRRKQPDKP